MNLKLDIRNWCDSDCLENYISMAITHKFSWNRVWAQVPGVVRGKKRWELGSEFLFWGTGARPEGECPWLQVLAAVTWMELRIYNLICLREPHSEHVQTIWLCLHADSAEFLHNIIDFFLAKLLIRLWISFSSLLFEIFSASTQSHYEKLSIQTC